MHLLRNFCFTKCALQREVGCSQFFYIVEYDENEETSCFNLHVITIRGTSFLSRNPSRKKNVNITNLERLFKQTRDKLYIVISALCVICG